jgi:acetate kinase
MSARAENLVLVLNAGSSSLKFAVFDSSPSLTRTFAGTIDRIGSPKASFTLRGIDSQETERAEIPAGDHVHSLEYLLERLSKTTGTATFGAVGHRVVHGGTRYREPQRVDNVMLTELRRISAFDPEHLPPEIALMETLAAKFPQTPQIACFDTAFSQRHAARSKVTADSSQVPEQRCATLRVSRIVLRISYDAT